MSTPNKPSRRRFLKNISAATAAVGVSPLALNAKATAKPPVADCDPTTLDLYGEGPFYTENPPVLEDGQLASPDEPGTRMIISGRVYDLECDAIIRDAIIDVWHADDAGQYDNEGYNLRGQVTSNDQGFYVFETIYPGKYLNGSEFRPSHIHFKITAPGFPTLTTQLYFEGDPDLDSDAASSVTSGTFDATNRIIALAENTDGKLEGTWDIVVDGDGISGVRDLHVDKGMIYNIGPNPFADRLTIRYGVFRKAKVGLAIFDTQGRLVARLQDENMTPEKYEAEWHPGSDIPAGHYFVILTVNDLQVHYQKVIKV